MKERLYTVGSKLAMYATGLIDRRTWLEEIQELGYCEQQAIFVLEILEDGSDDPFPHNSMHFPPRAEVVGEEKSDHA